MGRKYIWDALCRSRLWQQAKIGVVACWTGWARLMSQGTTPVDMNHDGVVDFYNISSGSPIPVMGGIAARVEAANSVYPLNAMTPAEVGQVIDQKASWNAQAASVGYFGIRFQALTGIHYGWIELHNPIFFDRPAFVSGGWMKRFYYNPNPGESMRVGDTNLVLRAIVNHRTKRLLLRWNTDASSLQSGLKVQSRPVAGTMPWSTVYTTASGVEVELALTDDARVYRLVQ